MSFPNLDKPQQSWAEEVERWDEVQQRKKKGGSSKSAAAAPTLPAVPEKSSAQVVPTTAEPDVLAEGVSLRTQIVSREVDDVKRYYRITEKIRTDTVRIPKTIAVRKHWKKFGQSENDPSGPNPGTTVLSAEDIRMQFLLSKDQGKDTTRSERKGMAVKCSLCNGDHFSKSCPMAKSGLAGDMTGSGLLATSATPFARPGERPGRSTLGSDRSIMDAQQQNTVRVSNLPDNVTEDDLRDLFSQSCGPLSRVYLGKDRKTQELRGFAFVTFRDRRGAQNAIDKINCHKYGHMILQVDWANRSREF